MEISQLKELAKRVSKEALFDIICTNQFPEDELVIFKDEVIKRGLEAELAETIKIKELNKSKIKEGVNKLSKKDLFNIINYNLNKFTEKELLIFKNEVKERGLEQQLAAVLKVKEADDIEFKDAVLNPSKDVLELLENFNAYMDKKHPGIATRVKENKIKKGNNASLTSIILGAVLMLIGVAFTIIAVRGNMIFYGVILAGIILLIRGIINTKS